MLLFRARSGVPESSVFCASNVFEILVIYQECMTACCYAFSSLLEMSEHVQRQLALPQRPC